MCLDTLLTRASTQNSARRASSLIWKLLQFLKFWNFSGALICILCLADFTWNVSSMSAPIAFTHPPPAESSHLRRHCCALRRMPGRSFDPSVNSKFCSYSFFVCSKLERALKIYCYGLFAFASRSPLRELHILIYVLVPSCMLIPH